ncbi:hypothetical protein [Neobacillus niacini]|uniref:hypothetical protein n=1 Tax=Neobacillus niacini TaxID=86668 RepID=UPI0028628545|nr:hypothetical protein [Neobacillus niacini]MDR6998764.1 hypothetical protein [Neobacillus niacini]
MKKLLGLVLTALIIYVIYIDLTVGTLPSDSVQTVEAKTETHSPKSTLPSFQATVEPGETVISIVEHQLKKPLPVSITELVKDFQLLNPGYSPEKIQVGASYQFPDYTK